MVATPDKMPMDTPSLIAWLDGLIIKPDVSVLELASEAGRLELIRRQGTRDLVDMLKMKLAQIQGGT